MTNTLFVILLHYIILVYPTIVPFYQNGASANCQLLDSHYLGSWVPSPWHLLKVNFG